MGPELLKMSNNHLFSDIQCLIPFKILGLSKVTGLFCSNAQGWAVPDSVPVEQGRCSAVLHGQQQQEGAGFYIRLQCALSSL